MAPKKKKMGRGRRSKSAGPTSASNPKPTAASPSASIPTGGATTTTQVIPSAPPEPTCVPPSSASEITTTQPLPSAPPVPIQETHQECVSCTPDSAPTTDLAGPSTAPSASEASTKTPTLLPITDDFMSLFGPALTGALAALHIQKKRGAENLKEMVVASLGLRLDDMESVVGSLLVLADKMGGEEELKMAFEAVENMEVLNRLLEVVEKLLLERRNRDGTGGSCGGSEGKGGGPDSGTGEGDGEGGGVSV